MPNANLNDLVLNVDVRLDAPTVSRAGFGTLLIAGPNFSPGSGALISFFTSLASVLVGTGLTDSTPEYRAAREAFAAGARRIGIGRLRARVAQVVTFGITGAADGTWTVTVDDIAYTFAATGSATAAAIATGLRAALGSVPGVTVSGSSTNVILTANVAGVGFTAAIAAPGVGTATTTTTTANRSVASELDAVTNENGDWFGLVISPRAAEDIRQTAAWAESNRRLFIGVSADANVITSATDDIGTTLKNLSRDFSPIIYHTAGTEYPDAAWAGRALSFSLDTGSPIWAFHALAGVTPSSLDVGQRDAALGKNVNVYLTLKSLPATYPGKVPSGKFIDEIVIREWLRARLEEDIAQALLDASARGQKIPYTDAGFAVFESILRRRYALGVAAGHFSPGQLTVSFPRRSEVDPADVAARRYSFTASIQLSGAIQSVSSTIFLTTSIVVVEA